MKHYPVMLPEVLSALMPQAGKTYVDGTFGNGGYSEACLKAADCTVIGLDRDPHVAARAEEMTETYSGRFRWIETAFSKMDQWDLPKVDGVVLDIGVSSMQLDQAERGFSFMRAGPLDMRMSQSGVSARDVVNAMSLKDMVRIFKIYGEEKRARRAAEAIIRAREVGAIATTDSLAHIIERALGRTGKIHPATRVFQALRIFVNDELGELYRGLCAAERVLAPQGRLIVVTFHSLEDRIVKQFLRSRSGEVSGGSRYRPEVVNEGPPASFQVTRRSTIKPSDKELSENPRSRSAKLRFAIRTQAPAFEMTEAEGLSVPSVYDAEWAA